MKKVLFIGIFSFVSLAPIRYAMEQVVDSSQSKISENPPSGAALEAQQHYDAGMTLYDSGKLNDALTAFKQADRLKPDDAHTKYMLGMVYSKSKSYKDAVDSFKQAVRFKPDWPEAHFKLGTMFYVLGRRSQSLEA